MAVHADIMEKDTGIDKDGGGKLSYADAVKDREKVEEKIGLSLAKNAELTNIAAKITKNVGARSYNQLGKQGQGKIDGEVDTFGGARAFKEGWGTLGASVFAVMNEIEQDGPTKTHYSTSHTENHPYFPTGEKKPEFDEPLASLNWEDLPKGAKQSLAGDEENVSPFTKLPASTYNELDFKGKLTLLKGFRYKNSSIHGDAIDFIAPGPTGIIATLMNLFVPSFISSTTKEAVKNIVNNPTNNELRTTAKDAIIEEMATAKEPLKAQLGALLDIVVDKHTSGDHTNIVRMNNDGGVKDQWIEDTVKAGKPIISGPSGHTLRYLNFWAEKRNEQNEAETNSQTPTELNNWPSLEAARLVMMANLLPPRHHSYDEVMTASIGIKDNVSDALKYEHKSSYEDLNNHTNDAKDIAQTAYEQSGANAIETNNALEEHIQNGITDRKDKQDAINQFIEAAKDKAAAEIRTAITALTTTPPN